MKNKAQTTFVTTLLLAVVLCLVMYMYYYSPTKQKTEALNATNATLNERVTTLETFYNEMPDNLAKIDDMQSGIREIIALFPADVLEEDAIFFAIDSVQLQNLQKLYADDVIPANERLDVSLIIPSENSKIDYTAMKINKPEDISTVDAAVVAKAEMEELVDSVVFRKRDVEYQNVTTYQNLKGLIQSINECPEKKTISKLSYNAVKPLEGEEIEPGTISGVITVSFYSINGTTKEYQPKDFGEYEIGGLSELFVQTAE